MSSNRKAGLWKLLAGWGAYWTVLVATTLSTPIALIAKFKDVAKDNASASASFNNGVFDATISQYGQTVWHGSEPALALALWIAGPPLLMWIAWLITRSRAEQREVALENETTDVWKSTAYDPSRKTPGAGQPLSGARMGELPQPGMPYSADVTAKAREEMRARNHDEYRR